MTHAVFFTRYDATGASSRTRAYEYVRPLAALGIDAVVVPRPRRGAFGEVLRRARDGAVVVLQKPSLTFAELDRLVEAAAGRIAVDFDDAIRMGYGPGDPADGIESLHATLRAARAVTAGSEPLAAWARTIAGCEVVCVPPAVDLERYPSARVHRETRPAEVVWIGSSGNHRDLEAARPALRELLARGAIRLRTIADRPLDPEEWPGVAWTPWSPADEVAQLLAADVAIMPLLDDERSRGRCGYKAVQAAACGLPVVASPVGGAGGVVRDGVTGFHARSQREWVDRLSRLAGDPGLRARLGAAARRHAVARHSLEANAPLLAAAIRAAADPRFGALRFRGNADGAR